jgi:hypothetical protein
MKRTLVAAGTTLGLLLVAPAAFAQARGGNAFGQEGQFIISADRLFQFFGFDNRSQAALGGNGGGGATTTVTDNETFFSFFYGSPPHSSGGVIDPFFTVPRVGFDYVIIPNLTIGGNLVAVFSAGGSSKTEISFNNGTTNTTSTSNPSVIGFGIAPRVGYILPLTDMFSLWPRGGLSYYIASSSQSQGGNSTSETINQLALDLEPTFVVTPLPHVGFTASLDVDIPLTGGISDNVTGGGVSSTTSGHSAVFYLGLDLGMLVYF